MGYQVILNSQNSIPELIDTAPFLGSDFEYEIACGSLWSNNYNFLSKEEKNFLFPQDQDEEKKLIDPFILKLIFEKILFFLEQESDNLPFEIEIDFERMNTENLDTDLYIDGVRCWIQGNSSYYQVVPKFKILNLPIENTIIEKWVNFKEEIYFGKNKYYLRKTSRFERYKDQIFQIINYCKMAINLKVKVYWYRED
ncbi:MAG: hypothetical protein ACEQSR_15005 [Candidatus Methylacidiphilales bacterium]